MQCNFKIQKHTNFPIPANKEELNQAEQKHSDIESRDLLTSATGEMNPSLLMTWKIEKNESRDSDQWSAKNDRRWRECVTAPKYTSQTIIFLIREIQEI